MKKNSYFLLFMLSIGFFFNACIKKSPANIEADILSASITQNELLERPPLITNNRIIFYLKNNYAGDFKFSPSLKLSSGATVQPESGTTLDFSHSQRYTVTSENKEWTKTYSISFQVAGQDTVLDFSFEKVDTINTSSPEGHYEEFYHLAEKDGKLDTIKNWSSGNPGYNILAATLVPSGEQLTPDFYPTAQTLKGYKGNGVILQTKATGSLGATFGSALAAGNLYIGTFVLTFPTVNSTRFGLPYNLSKAPKALTGYFKYKAGDSLEINNKPSALTKDTWNAYAVLFEKTDDGDNYLSTGHIFDDDRVVSIALLDEKQRIETDQWTFFNIPFENVSGKSFNPQKKYMYTIVFTSSKEGDQFNGAVGSTLQIDEVKLSTVN